MPSVVYLCRHSHQPLVQELTRSGFTVWEALSGSEVLRLCEHEDIDAVIVEAGVEHRDLPEIRSRVLTLELEESASTGAVIWELSQLFPSAHSRVH